MSDHRPVFADRLNELFATVGQRDEKGVWREFSTPHVARAISEDDSHDTTMSRVYLATLRSGANTNPTIAVVRAIARFFDAHRAAHDAPVTASYLLGEDAEEIEWRRALADHQVRAIAMRAGEMSPQLRRQVLRMLDVLDETGSAD
ncbi:hypothetical protein KIH74_25275 [Kineosporia sp. J2-2]|uniref:XRE family transcriptional regulator n=1 Tax=Kineosporia corallincola TaxID=2835133 RepID=A0ABS5TMH3_9ACTN|nr:hypothetical protein [Kineosporia corallincola]MBT0772282.1 hypothetical protein [Kineosporia corallincola]